MTSSDPSAVPTEPPTTEAATTQPPTSEAATTQPSVAEPEPVLGQELVGRWAHYDVVAYEDDVLKALIISYGFNDFTEVDGRIGTRAVSGSARSAHAAPAIGSATAVNGAAYRSASRTNFALLPAASRTRLTIC